jgi:hypothetical protein
MAKKTWRNAQHSFPAIKDMQINTTLRFELTPVRWLSSRTQTTTNVGKDVGKKITMIFCW